MKCHHPPIVQMTNDVFCLFVFWGFQTKITKHYSLLQKKKNVNFSHKITCQQQKDSSTSALTTVQLDSFNTSIFFPFFIVEEIISQSQIKVNTAVRRAFLLYYKEKKPLCGQKIQDWSFFFFLFLWNAAVQTARVNCLSSLKSHHIHLGMDVLGCWKSGPLVHRATK